MKSLYSSPFVAQFSKLCCSRKINIHTPPTEDPHPHGKFQFMLILSLKILAFKTPLLLEISNDPLWWGFGYFLEPHNAETLSTMKRYLSMELKEVFCFQLYMNIKTFLLTLTDSCLPSSHCYFQKWCPSYDVSIELTISTSRVLNSSKRWI